MRVKDRNRLQLPMQPKHNHPTTYRSLPPKFLPPIQKLLPCYQYNLCKAEMQNIKFANCNHFGSCINCAQNHMLKSIKKNEYPICFLDLKCKEKMIMGSGTMFEYFSNEAKKKWEFFKNKNKDEKENLKKINKKCLKEKCPGFIIQNICTKCLIFYCEKCGQTDHTPDEKCISESTQSSILLKEKECLKCKSKKLKEENEMTMVFVCEEKTCGWRFCWSCKKLMEKNENHDECKKLADTDCCNIF